MEYLGVQWCMGRFKLCRIRMCFTYLLINNSLTDSHILMYYAKHSLKISRQLAHE